MNILKILIPILVIGACDQKQIDRDKPQDQPTTTVMKTTSIAKNTKFVKGEVFYRERIALPPGSMLTVTLEDVSRMDVASTVISKKTKMLKTAPPYYFQLPYDNTKIQDKFRYGIRAKIENNGKLLFTTTKHIDPFEESQPLKIILEKIQVERTQTLSKTHKTPLIGTQWRLIRLKDREIEDKVSWQPYWVIDPGKAKVSGFSGCNHFSGKYTIADQTIQFTQLASTKKMCIKNMDLEMAFLAVSQSKLAYQIEGQKLILKRANKVVAEFEAKL